MKKEIPLIKQIRNDLGTYDNFKRLKLIELMITQLIVY